jgi:hypothetical protein
MSRFQTNLHKELPSQKIPEHTKKVVQPNSGMPFVEGNHTFG